MASRAIKNRCGVKKKHASPGVLSVIAVIFGVIVALSVGVYALGSSWLTDLPDYEDASAYNAALPTEVYASDGATLLAKFQLEWREPVSIDQVSPYVLEGTVATEDERFYDHAGFDLAGIARAAVNNLTGGEREGASTITQQFVRNTILSSEMDEISYKRKVREIYLAMKLEQVYSKEDILLMYLNTINYGSGAYGIEAASKRYFSKSASDLTLAEAATLVGIPQSPTYNNPIDNPEQCVARRNLVLDRMLSNGYITQEEHDAAVAEPLVLNPTEQSDDGLIAYPYFTSYVRNLLMDENGSYKYSTAEIFKGGLKVITTLDVNVQQQAERAAAKKRTTLDDSMEVAIAAVEPGTGYVKALVGGSNYDEEELNLATGEGTDGGRPCGSAFKTFTLVSAIERGIDPDTTNVDCSSPATVDGYTLRNIDNINYGTRSITRAFAVSSNTGFVRLISSLGTNSVIDVAERMGITSDLRSSGAGASLTLGVANVTPLDMANSFATISSGGKHYDPQPVLQIYDRKGAVVIDNTNPEGDQALTPEVAYAAATAMQSVLSYEGTGAGYSLPNGQPVACKTGTSENSRDITFTGTIPQIAVSVWVGDPSNQNVMPHHSMCVDVFMDFVGAVWGGDPVRAFPTADDPPYKPYNDAKYHIGSGYWSGSQGEDKKDDEADDEKKDGENNPSTTDDPTVAPVDPATPVDPVTPVDPATPVDPVTPVEPTNPDPGSPAALTEPDDGPQAASNRSVSTAARMAWRLVNIFSPTSEVWHPSRDVVGGMLAYR
ncbi:transglycosylase domain-containing protein [Adlercreutzia sp. ZJ141]|uniref:transglycosylase domain-containing protein n=1 Tax=Adlercreutzia sp. ZJ141 TaxID=2709406 RepID=UPI0013EAF1F3|nr:transglycosylase domain-containing protein [Adlercreutzia sp. ZJ141]